MSKIHCEACGYTIDESGDKVTLLIDVQKWINYVLALHLKQGETASHINRLKNCPPCPQCKVAGKWANELS